MAAERLQKIIAGAGIASRRKAEELITGGRVTVNGQVVTELGSKADPESDHIKVDGKLLHGPERHIYLALNKPRGYVTTVTDPEGRPTVMDLVKHVGERIYPVGRLDFNSEGLLVLTNDGELANFLTLAGSHVPKTYLVKVAGQPQEEDVEKLRHGIRIGNKPGERGPRSVRTAPAEVRLLREADNPWYEVTLIEGKNRQIRRMFEAIGHHVEKIKRVSYGSLKLDLEPGEFRELTPQEISALRKPPKPRESEGERPAAKIHARHIGKAALKKTPFRKDKRRFRDDREQLRRGEQLRPDDRERRQPREEKRPFRPAAAAGEQRRPFQRDERTSGSAGDRGQQRFRRDEGGQERREFRGGPRSDRPRRDRQEREGGERGPREFRGGGLRQGGGARFSNRGEQERGPRSDRPRSDRPRPERREREGGERGPREFRGGGRRQSKGAGFSNRGERESGRRSDRLRSDRPSPDRREREGGEQGERRGFSSRRGPRSGRPTFGGRTPGGERGGSGRQGKPPRERGARGPGRPRGKFRP